MIYYKFSNQINWTLIDTFTFSGGEIHLKIDSFTSKRININAFIQNSNDLMALLLFNDALIRLDQTNSLQKTLFLQYVPYARQDRICNLGEPLSIKVFANLINSCNFDRVVTLDNHSDVATALINNCDNIPQHYLAKDSLRSRIFKSDKLTLVVPDQGARKKVEGFHKLYPDMNLVQALKVRDVSTGQIIKTEILTDTLEGQDCLILDDICDGGRTFIELAKVMKQLKANKLYLYVTHGIFRSGILELLEYYDEIYTTGSRFPFGMKKLSEELSNHLNNRFYINHYCK